MKRFGTIATLYNMIKGVPVPQQNAIDPPAKAFWHLPKTSDRQAQQLLGWPQNFHAK